VEDGLQVGRVIGFVIAGLDPAIHPSSKEFFQMDARVKPAHDSIKHFYFGTRPLTALAQAP
jgi:hypothetical protein